MTVGTNPQRIEGTISPSHIFESNDIYDLIRALSPDHPYQIDLTHLKVGFDLDNTLFEPTDELGSAQWFRHFLTFAYTKMTDEEEARKITVTIHRAVQYTIHVKPVDPVIINVISQLQARGIPCFGLTARGEDIADITFEQLRKIGVDFSTQFDSGAFYFAVDENRRAYFKNGVIFCAGYDKGACLMAFCKALGLPIGDTMMTDDEEKNLHHIKSAVEKEGGRLIGLRYSYLDEKVAQFNMEVAASLLIKMRCLLANEAKAAVDRLHTTSNHHRPRTQSWTAPSRFVNLETASEPAKPVDDRLEILFRGSRSDK